MPTHLSVQELARYHDERLTTVRIKKYCRNVGTPTPVGEASWKFLERANIPNLKMPVETEQALMISAHFMRQRPSGGRWEEAKQLPVQLPRSWESGTVEVGPRKGREDVRGEPRTAGLTDWVARGSCHLWSVER